MFLTLSLLSLCVSLSPGPSHPQADPYDPTGGLSSEEGSRVGGRRKVRYRPKGLRQLFEEIGSATDVQTDFPAPTIANPVILTSTAAGTDSVGPNPTAPPKARSSKSGKKPPRLPAGALVCSWCLAHSHKTIPFRNLKEYSQHWRDFQHPSAL